MNLIGKLEVKLSQEQIEDSLLKLFKESSTNQALLAIMDLGVNFNITRNPTKINAAITLTPKSFKNNLKLDLQEIFPESPCKEKEFTSDESEITEDTSAFNFDAE